MPHGQPYACSGCARTFKHKSSFNRHRREAHTSQQIKQPVHQNDICTWCDAQFSSTGLQRHLQFHKTCSRLQKIATGQARLPSRSTDSSSNSDSSTSGSSASSVAPPVRGDDMEDVHFEPPPRNRGDRSDSPDPDVCLNQKVDTEGHTVFVEPFPCPHAGQPIRRVNKTKKSRRSYPDVGALSDPEAFEIAELLMQSGVSAKFRNRYLRLKRMRGKMPWHNNRAMLKDIDKLPHGPDWEVEPFKLTGNCGDEIVELWKRNPLDIIRAILRDKTLRKYLHYVPERHYTGPEGTSRRRSELWTGDWLWDTQGLIDDKWATIISCIVSSDETKLTNFAGDKKAHPVYLTIGNLPKRLRRRISKRTSVLIGYLPVPKFTCETNNAKRLAAKRDLFHQCLASILEPLAEACNNGGVEAECSDGGVRRIYPVLASYIADYPEQCKIACTKLTHCPLCVVPPEARGEPGDSALRDREDTLQTLKEEREGPSARFNWLGLFQTEPFWANHPYVDTGSFLTPDLLHQVHKGVMKDHLIKWVTHILGKPIIDERYISMPESHGMRHFKNGITSVSQWTGRELKEMTKILLPALSDTNREVVVVARALLDFMYISHLGSMTDDDIDALEDALRTFHDHKEVFRELGAVATDKGFDGIPKIHMVWHYMHLIRQLGTPDGYNTETSERLHIDFAKLGYRASNKVNATKQMAIYIQRLEAIEMHATYLLETAEMAENPQGAKTTRQDVERLSELVRSETLEDEEEDEEEWDAWHDEDDEEDEAEELADVGIQVLPMVNLGEKKEEHRGNPWDEVTAPPEADDTANYPMYYPNPKLVLAKTPTTTASVSDIRDEHGIDADKFLYSLHSFLCREVPEHRNTKFNLVTKFNIWRRARLFHSPPPFQPSEGPHIDVIRAQPLKTDQYQRVCRPQRFDTALILAFPQRTGIHRYRPGRVRVIFNLPSNVHRGFTEPLAYVELFNSASAQPTSNLGLFTTTRSLAQGQRAALVVRLSAVRLACHLAPKYNTQDANTTLSAVNDTLGIFKTYYVNIFSNHLVYNLFRHWGQDGMKRRIDSDDEMEL